MIVGSESWRVGIAFGLTNYAAARRPRSAHAPALARSGAGRDRQRGFAGHDEQLRLRQQARATAVGRAGTPRTMGALVAYLVSDEAGWMTGQTLPLNGGAITA